MLCLWGVGVVHGEVGVAELRLGDRRRRGEVALPQGLHKKRKGLFSRFDITDTYTLQLLPPLLLLIPP